jgi:predicted acyl esterase
VRRGLAGAAPAIIVALLAVLATAAPASADLTSLKAACQTRDAADGDTGNGVQLPFRFCDDGVPPTGGRTPNLGAIAGVAVPQRYEGFEGLPPKATPDPNAGADPDGNIALDVDVSLPDPAKFPPPPGGYPLVAMMHGCCAGDKTGWEAPSVDAGGERWHYSNAWFASRGYVVINYTSRGFVNGENRGSTGENQLDSRLYEINDFQHLAGQLADDPFFSVDPSRIVATGGSYGGGFTWMAYTDPTWRSPGGKDLKLAAAAPKYGWTDLPYSLIPNGHHFDGQLPPTSIEQAANPFGIPKTSINAGLFVSGATGIPNASGQLPPHTTFPQSIFESMVCLSSGDPFENNPACTNAVENTLPTFYSDRSAYYQNHFFDRLATDPAARVPLFSAGTFTDQLFTMIEHRRMVDRIKSVVPDYPVQEFYGDYNHFVQNKPKEWGDVCGADRHVCRFADYPGGDLNAEPAGRVRTGATSRLTAFLDHYVKPQGNPSQPKPANDVTGSLQVCPQNAYGQPLDEPGDRFTAPTFDQLAPNTLTIAATGAQATANGSADAHALNSDPVGNSTTNGGRCPTQTTPPGGAVAVYDSDALPSDFTMLGSSRVHVTHTGAGQGAQLNARLYEVFPDGTQVLMDRGVHRLTDLNGTTVLPLHGNGWRFAKGHRIRIELTQNDAPFVRASNQPSSLLISAVRVEVPVREASASLGAGAAGSGPPTVDLGAPRLASDTSRDPRFQLTLRGGNGADHYELEVRNRRGSSSWKRLTSTLRSPTYSFAGYFGSAYEFRARAVDRFGRRGAWDSAATVVPFDDSRRRSKPSFGRGWSSVRLASAWGQRLTRTKSRGRTMKLAFKGAGTIYLIARTSPAGGRAALTIDGRSRRIVKFRSKGARNRVLVATIKAKGSKRHVLRLTTLGGTVEVDGVGVATR